MTLRPAREEDLRRIVEIYNSTIPGRQSTADLEPVTVAERLSWFRSHHRRRPIFVCEIAGSVAAWFSFEDFYGRAAYAHTAELSLYVALQSRGQGLGGRLLARALQMAPAIGVRSVLGYVFAHNEPSLRLLKSSGFQEWGRLPGVAEMEGRRYDVLIMGKKLPSDKVTIDERFHGPRKSGNGGYVCGRLAAFIDGTARVRLYVPPPLDAPLDVVRRDTSVSFEEHGKKIAEGWPARLDIEVPEPPGVEEARAASEGFRGFSSHRFPTCFVCGRDRRPGEGLRIFAGPVPGRSLLACPWTPGPDLAGDDGAISPEYIWCVLDCPGGFAFPEPETGTILLGELTVARYAPVAPGETLVVTAWAISDEGRKHHTGTGLFSADGRCLAAGQGVWFEVEAGLVE